MAKIVILGAGVMGSAFSLPPSDRGHDVRLVGTHLDRRIIESVAQSGWHPGLKSPLPESVRPYTYDRLGEALGEDCDLVVFGVSSPGVGWACRQLAPLLSRPLPIMILTKGLVADDSGLRIIPEVIAARLAELGAPASPVAAVAGPCIAGELAARRHSSVILTHSDRALIDWLIELVAAPYYHPRPNPDQVGVEVCAAFKNLYAIGVGSSEGLLERDGVAENGARMHNPAASLYAQAVTEMNLLVSHLGGLTETVRGLAGTGDLYVTIQGGRNSRMGKLLGAGLRYSNAKAERMPDDTIEGAELALAIGPALESEMAAGGLGPTALPLAHSLIKAICHDALLEFPWTAFHRAA